MYPNMLLIIILLTGMLTGFSSCSKENKENNTMEITSITPLSPAEMAFGEFVLIRYKYQIDHPEGARMWVIPYTHGEKSPGYQYSSSKVFNGSGGREVGFSIKDGNQPVIVDQLRIVMDTPDQDKNLYEAYIDVKYTFKK